MIIIISRIIPFTHVMELKKTLHKNYAKAIIYSVIQIYSDKTLDSLFPNVQYFTIYLM